MYTYTWSFIAASILSNGLSRNKGKTDLMLLWCFFFVFPFLFFFYKKCSLLQHFWLRPACYRQANCSSVNKQTIWVLSLQPPCRVSNIETKKKNEWGTCFYEFSVSLLCPIRSGVDAVCAVYRFSLMLFVLTATRRAFRKRSWLSIWPKCHRQPFEREKYTALTWTIFSRDSHYAISTIEKKRFLKKN